MLAIIAILGTIIIAWGFHIWQLTRKVSGIPGNLGFPVVGNILQSVRYYWQSSISSYHMYLEKLSNKYGDVFCCWSYNKIHIAISDPHVIERIVFHSHLLDKPTATFDNIGWFMKNTFTYSTSDQEWKLRRKELYNNFKKSSVLSYRQVFNEKAKKVVGMWSKRAAEFDCYPQVMLLAVETSCSTHFGLDLNITEDIHLFEEIHFASELNAINYANPLIGKLFIGISFFHFPKILKKFHNMIVKSVKKNLVDLTPAGEKQRNIAATVALRNISRNSSEQDLLREFVELLYVGSHAIGVVLSTALVCLATNPDVQERIWQEQLDILGESNKDPTYEDIRRMEYLDRFYKEVLRFAAPPVLLRQASGDIEIDGMTIPAGAVVTIQSHRMRFDNRYWEDPKKFDPDRFLKEHISKVPKSVCAFFGYGIRNCPGFDYANSIVKLIALTIVKNFKLHSTRKFEELKFHSSVMMEMVGGYNISLEKRP